MKDKPIDNKLLAEYTEVESNELTPEERRRLAVAQLEYVRTTLKPRAIEWDVRRPPCNRDCIDVETIPKTTPFHSAISWRCDGVPAGEGEPSPCGRFEGFDRLAVFGAPLHYVGSSWPRCVFLSADAPIGDIYRIGRYASPIVTNDPCDAFMYHGAIEMASVSPETPIYVLGATSELVTLELLRVVESRLTFVGTDPQLLEWLASRYAANPLIGDRIDVVDNNPLYYLKKNVEHGGFWIHPETEPYHFDPKIDRWRRNRENFWAYGIYYRQ